MPASKESGTWINQQVANGRYHVTCILGEGGMGCVYKAIDRTTRSPVVIKVPHRDLLHDKEFVGRFKREVIALLKLDHNHIVPVIDYGVHRGIPFVAMPFLGGGSLVDILDIANFDDPKQRLRGIRHWLPEICNAVDYRWCNFLSVVSIA